LASRSCINFPGSSRKKLRGYSGVLCSASTSIFYNLEGQLKVSASLFHFQPLNFLVLLSLFSLSSFSPSYQSLLQLSHLYRSTRKHALFSLFHLPPESREHNHGCTSYTRHMSRNTIGPANVFQIISAGVRISAHLHNNNIRET